MLDNVPPKEHPARIVPRPDRRAAYRDRENNDREGEHDEEHEAIPAWRSFGAHVRCHGATEPVARMALFVICSPNYQPFGLRSRIVRIDRERTDGGGLSVFAETAGSPRRRFGVHSAKVRVGRSSI